MTLAIDIHAAPQPSFIKALAHRSRALTATGLVLLILLVPLGLANLMDTRIVAGSAVWDKPMRFALALCIYTLTLAFFAGWMSEAGRRSRLFRVAIASGIAAIVFEQAWITVQAARGTSSHFNTGTGFETAMWSLMGIGAVVLTLMAPVVGFLVWRSPKSGLAPALRTSAALGLVLTLPLTLVTAGTLAENGGYLIGERSVADAGLFLMGWSREVGDLRVAHFFGTHALHAVPLAAAALIPVFGRDRMGPSLAIAALYSLFVLAVFAQALMGRPFF